MWSELAVYRQVSEKQILRVYLFCWCLHPEFLDSKRDEAPTLYDFSWVSLQSNAARVVDLPTYSSFPCTMRVAYFAWLQVPFNRCLDVALPFSRLFMSLGFDQVAENHPTGTLGMSCWLNFASPFPV